MSLVDYPPSDDDDASPSLPAVSAVSVLPAVSALPAISAAPDVSLEDPMELRQSLIKPGDMRITHNMTYEQLTAAELGPLNPFLGADAAARKRKNVPTGYAETSGISDATFRAQHRTFNSLGYAAVDGGGGGGGAGGGAGSGGGGLLFVGDQASVRAHDGKDVVQLRPSKALSQALRHKRQKKGDAAILDGDGAYLGPWARYAEAAMPARDADDEQADEYESAGDDDDADVVLAPTSKPIIDKAGREYLDINTGGVGKETSEFHGSALLDYAGRTYMHVPQDLDVDLRKEPGSHTNFIPKKLVHTWKGHTKPITALRFFPSSGHLLLSSASDSKVKVGSPSSLPARLAANGDRSGTCTTNASCCARTTGTPRP